MTDKNDLSTQAKQALDESVKTLPDHVQSQLAKAREQALLAHKEKGQVLPFNGHWSKELIALAACVSLIVPIWFGLSSYQSNTVMEPQGLELMVSLAEMDEEEWELVDDLEFALWLNEQSNLADEVKSS